MPEAERPVPEAERPVSEAERLVPEVIAVYPHDDAAFTQGLLIEDGRMFESTGLWEESAIRETDLATGRVLRNLFLTDAELEQAAELGQAEQSVLFGEGLALVDDDRLIQLTWQAGLAFVWEVDTFHETGQPAQIFDYRQDGQGWGLCYDGTQLVMSNGSDKLWFRDPETFQPIGAVAGEAEGRASGKYK